MKNDPYSKYNFCSALVEDLDSDLASIQSNGILLRDLVERFDYDNLLRLDPVELSRIRRTLEDLIIYVKDALSIPDPIGADIK